MIHLLTDDVYDYIKGKGTAETGTQLNILLQILVSESLEKIQKNRSARLKAQWHQIQVYKDMLQQKAVTSFELEKEVNKSKNEDEAQSMVNIETVIGGDENTTD